MKGWLALAAAVLIAAMAFVAERAVAFHAAGAELAARRQSLEDAASAARKLRSMSNARKIQSGEQLKQIVYQCSAKAGVPLLYVTDFDRDAGQDLREQSVLCRSTNIPQAKLAAFLAQTEQVAGSAKVKELRLKQSPQRSDLFQEVEAVIAVRSAKPQD